MVGGNGALAADSTKNHLRHSDNDGEHSRFDADAEPVSATDGLAIDVNIERLVEALVQIADTARGDLWMRHVTAMIEAPTPAQPFTGRDTGVEQVKTPVARVGPGRNVPVTAPGSVRDHQQATPPPGPASDHVTHKDMLRAIGQFDEADVDLQLLRLIAVQAVDSARRTKRGSQVASSQSHDR